MLVACAAFTWGCSPARVVAPGAASVCALTPEQVQGPYYLDDAKLRADIREGKPGVPLRLALTLVDVRTCRGVEGAAVDVWHCDSGGLYSGFVAASARLPPPDGPPPPTAEALVDPPFPTAPAAPPLAPDPVHPASRRMPSAATPSPSFAASSSRAPRAPSTSRRSIRAGTPDVPCIFTSACGPKGTLRGERVRGGHLAHTGQLYFPEEVTDAVFRLPPYGSHPGERMQRADDPIFADGGTGGLVSLSPVEDGSAASGYLASATLAFDPSRTPAVRR
jgi:hypothetical protein